MQKLDKDGLRRLALFVPRLLKLIGKLIGDSEVDPIDKVLLGAAVVYVASPFDLIPDAVPVFGQLDDLYVLALCLLRLLNHSGKEKLEEHWDGPEDILDLLETVTDASTRYLPTRIRGKIRNWVEAKSNLT